MQKQKAGAHAMAHVQKELSRLLVGKDLTALESALDAIS
jgi:hypothetical protein